MHQKIIRHFAISIFLVFIFTQCAPIPVYRLHPIDNDVYSRWVRGHQILRIEGQKYDAALAFAKQVNSMLAFDLQVINKSDTMISVVPDSIYAVNFTGYYIDSLGHANPLYPSKDFFARNPEKELIGVDSKMHHEDARIATDRFLDATYSMLDVVYDAASIVQSPTPQQREQHQQDEIENDAYMAKSEVQHANIVQSLNEQHFQWSTEALRRTDLAPDETIRGLVFVTADPEAKILGLHLNIAGEDHLIYFRQKKYK